MEACQAKYENFVPPTSGAVYCNATFDTYLCWGPTLAGAEALQNCPPARHSDTTTCRKRCSIYGYWEGKEMNETIGHVGWTNYTTCYSPAILELLTKLSTGDSAAMKLDIAAKTRQLEICGFSLSLASLLLSLGIFCHFRSLRNNRTRIHKNLFVAMVVQVMIRLTLYIDQALLRKSDLGDFKDEHLKGIENTPYLCEGSYILLEYARTAMFMWMFIEGMYLHNMVTVTVFQERQYHGLYYAMGWGFPVILTSAWAITTGININGKTACWWGYNFTNYYWILEGPRLGVILLNFVFLLNIIRVLVMKLRQSHTSEIDQVRKAVRAAVVLLPLLGITNLLTMTQAPLERAPWEFAIWSYTTHFLTSFQGFFIALLYCFLNGEVRTAVMKQVSLFMDMRDQRAQFRRSSAFHYVSSEMNRREVIPPRETKQPCWHCFGKWCTKEAAEVVESPPLEATAPETQV